MAGSFGWIRLRGLEIANVRIGVYPHERRVARALQVDVGLWAAVGGAAQTDKLAATIDYDRIGGVVTEVAQSRHYNLLETLSETLAEALLERFGVERVEVEVHKSDVQGGAVASVAIERDRSATP